MGWILCDESNSFIAAKFISWRGLFHPKVEQAVAIREALSWMKFYKYKKFQVESEALLVIKALNSCNFESSIDLILLDIKYIWWISLLMYLHNLLSILRIRLLPICLLAKKSFLFLIIQSDFIILSLFNLYCFGFRPIISFYFPPPPPPKKKLSLHTIGYWGKDIREY